MRVKIVLYENTNFDSINIPDSYLTLITKFEPKFEDIISITHPLINNVRIKIKFEDVVNVDYVVMYDEDNVDNFYFYTVNSINYVNDNVCSLNLQLDALTSLGRLDQLNITGFLSRAHIKKEDDIIGRYTIDENFTPNEPLKLDVSKQFGQTKNNLDRTPVLETSVKPNNNQSSVLRPTESVSNNEVLLVASIDSVPNGIAKLRLEFGVVKLINPNGTYILSNINDIATMMRKYGIENGILASYNIPNTYCDNSLTTDNTVASAYTLTSFSNIGINLFFMEVANKKSFTQFTNLKLMSNCSGNSFEVKNISDIIPNDNGMELGIFADPRSNGRPTCYFRYYKGSYQGDKTPLAKVDGMVWENNPILYTDKSGSNVDIMNLKDTQELQKTNLNTKALQGLANTTYNAITNTINNPFSAKENAINGLMDVGGQVVNYAFDKTILENQLNTELKIFNRTLQFQQPDLKFTRNESVRDYYGNGFLVAYTHLSIKDTIRFDTYLTRFGYAVDEEYDPIYLLTRSKFNFIQFSEVEIFCDRPKWLRELAKIQLKNGVRLWHEKPSTEAMERFGNP